VSGATSEPVADAAGSPSPAPARPPAEYPVRLGLRRQRLAVCARRERVVGFARIAAFLVGLAVAWLAFGWGMLSAGWLLLPVVIFVALLLVHDRIRHALNRARRAVRFYERRLAVLENRWQGQGQAGARFLDETHPYAPDLDLFGPGSLFELLCNAHTRAGEDTLADWLRGPAGPVEVRARQGAVAELRPLLELREELALAGGEVPAGIDFHAVVAWGQAPPALVPRWPRWVVLALGVLSLITVTGWVLSLFGLVGEGSAFGRFFLRYGSLPFLLVAVVQILLVARLRRRVQAVLGGVERRGRDLAMLAHLLGVLERAAFAPGGTCARLQGELSNPAEGGNPPSQRIARLSNLIDVLESRRNQFFAPFALLLLWGTQLAYAIDRWRCASGPAIAGWLQAVGTFEALCSFAAYAYENPEDPFPEVVEEGPCYEGEGLGHPLLPGCIRNDLCLGPEVRVLIVSGSNMSGKSTFLRTVGVNAVLALAGAPVRARRLRLSPLAVGATLRIQDSLQAGRSRFYAELLRLRQLVDQAKGPLPLLFLLDELFAGTNSHDRRIGAEALVKGLVEAGAVGLLTTHDLTLTAIADRLAPRAANVHFADHFEEGEIHFDYLLHPGVVQKSNALALMRAVGLEV
jgi:hypothetical protein